MPIPEGPPLTVVDQVRRLRVPGKRADAAQAGLREQRIVRQAVVLEQRLQYAGSAAKPKAIDGQHRDFGINLEPCIARGRMSARHGFAHDHPQCVERRYVVAAGEQKLVAERMLRAAVVVAQAAVFGAGQVQGDVVGRVRRAARRSARSAGSCRATSRSWPSRSPRPRSVGGRSREHRPAFSLASPRLPAVRTRTDPLAPMELLSPNGTGARRLSPRHICDEGNAVDATASIQRTARLRVCHPPVGDAASR